MSDLKLSIEEKVTVMDRIGRWLPRLVVALLFFPLGMSKFASDGLWVKMFDQIGFGQWFRILTGILQTGGALMLLVPRIAWIGAVILSCTMLGAILTQVFILHMVLLALSPAVLMVITAALALQAYDRR